MSIYSLIAYNSAVNQMKQNEENAANLEAKRTQTAQAQEDLAASKKLDVAKVKQANVEGMMSDVAANALTKQLNNQYSAHQDVVGASSELQDSAKLKLEQQQKQLQQVAQTHAQNVTPDDHDQLSSMLSSINNQNNMPSFVGAQPQQSQQTPQAQSSVNAPSIIPNQSAQIRMPNSINAGPNLTGINPSQVGAGQGLDAQVRANGVQQPVQPSAQPPVNAQQTIKPAQVQTNISAAPAQQIATPSNNNIPISQASQQASNLPQTSQPTGSPLVDAANTISEAYGMPKNSMWLDPSTGKFGISPIWKANMEAHQRAQASYDVNHPYAEVKNQETLEKQYADRLDKGMSNRSGGVGLMDQKVNQATLAQQLLDQYYDPKTGEYHVPTAQYTDLAISLATLLAPSSQASDSKVDAIKQRTLAGDYNGMLQYITGSPKDATTPAMIQNLADSIKREGLQAEKQRDIYLNTLRSQAPSQLNEVTRRRLEGSSMYPSFREYLMDSPSSQRPTQPQSTNSGGNDDAFIKYAIAHGATEQDARQYLQGKNAR